MAQMLQFLLIFAQLRYFEIVILTLQILEPIIRSEAHLTVFELAFGLKQQIEFGVSFDGAEVTVDELLFGLVVVWSQPTMLAIDANPQRVPVLRLLGKHLLNALSESPQLEAVRTTLLLPQFIGPGILFLREGSGQVLRTRLLLARLPLLQHQLPPEPPGLDQVLSDDGVDVCLEVGEGAGGMLGVPAADELDQVELNAGGCPGGLLVFAEDEVVGEGLLGTGVEDGFFGADCETAAVAYVVSRVLLSRLSMLNSSWCWFICFEDCRNYLRIRPPISIGTHSIEGPLECFFE